MVLPPSKMILSASWVINLLTNDCVFLELGSEFCKVAIQCCVWYLLIQRALCVISGTYCARCEVSASI